MELALAITAFIFSFLAFVIAAGTLSYVLIRRFSSVEVRYEAPPETTYQFEQPPVLKRDEDGEPQLVRSPPVTLTEAEYAKRQRLDEMERHFEREAADIDF